MKKRRIVAMLLACCMLLSAFVPGLGKVAKANELLESYGDLLESTTDCMKAVMDLVEGKPPEFDTFKAIVEQCYNIFDVTKLAIEGILDVCSERFEAVTGRYLLIKKNSAFYTNMTYDCVMEDINLYGNASISTERANQLSDWSTHMLISVDQTIESIDGMLDDWVFCLATPSAQLDLLEKMRDDLKSMKLNTVFGYQHIYRVIQKAVLTNPQKPGFNSCTINMPITRTGYVATVQASTISISQLTYEYQWYRNGALVATQQLKTNQASYTINSPGNWHVIVKITDSLGQTQTTSTPTVVVSQTAVSPTKLTMNTTGYTLAQGQTVSLAVTYSPANTTEKGLVWSSSNSAVATVNSSGVVTAKAEGTVTITATSASNSAVKATATITVSGRFKDLHMTNVGTTNAQINVSLVQDFYLTECGFFIGTSASSMSKVTEGLNGGAWVNTIWYDMNKWGCMLNPGTRYYYQFYIVNYGTTYYSEIQSFETLGIPVSGISLNQTSITLEKNDTATLLPVYSPTNATYGKEIAWSSSAPEVVSVTNGQLKALDGGEALITAYSLTDDSISAVCSVSVHDPDDDLTINSLTVTSGESFVGDMLAVDVNYSGVIEDKMLEYLLYRNGDLMANDMTMGETRCAWVIQEPGVYQIVVTAIDPYVGEQTLESSQYTFTYRYSALQLDREKIALNVGESVNVYAQITPDNETFIQHQGTLYISSSNADVVTVVSANDSANGVVYGKITAVHPGWCNVYFSTGENNGLTEKVEVCVYAEATYILPAQLSTIEESAFEGDTTVEMVVVENSSVIGTRAFADCTSLKYVYLEDCVQSIASDAFAGSNQVVIYCRSGSCAHQYAIDSKIPFVLIEK